MTSLIPRPHRPTFHGSQMIFGSYIRQIRLAKHMTLRACAEAIGLAAGHYSNIENGRVGPPDESTLTRLAETLDIPIAALLSRAGRLKSEDLQRFWSSPLIPSLIMYSTGWTQAEAAMFQETVLSSL